VAMTKEEEEEGGDEESVVIVERKVDTTEIAVSAGSDLRHYFSCKNGRRKKLAEGRARKGGG
jgi:hypothetical protein